MQLWSCESPKSLDDIAQLVDGDWTLRRPLQPLFTTILLRSNKICFRKISFAKSELISKKDDYRICIPVRHTEVLLASVCKSPLRVTEYSIFYNAKYLDVIFASSTVWKRQSNLIQEAIKRRLNSDNTCYLSVQNLLSSRLLSKKVRIVIYKTIILSVVLYGCQTLFLKLGLNVGRGCLRTGCWKFLERGGWSDRRLEETA
jgi:hypothetical protein